MSAKNLSPLILTVAQVSLQKHNLIIKIAEEKQLQNQCYPFRQVKGINLGLVFFFASEEPVKFV